MVKASATFLKNPRQFLLAALLGVTLSFDSMAQDADVIFVVDTSGSMEAEIITFSTYLASAFAAPILDAQINLNMTVIGSSSICIPPPVGNGDCENDSNPPLYLHVATEVLGNDSLTKVLTTFDQWQIQLRSGSQRTIIALTDGSADLTAQQFQDSLLTLDPEFAGFKFHGMVQVSCDQDSEFVALAADTGGTTYDICIGGGYEGAGVGLALSEIASIIINDAGDPPPPPPPTACGDAVDLALDAGSTYVKATRTARRECRNAPDLDCTAAVDGSTAAFEQLAIANSEVEAACQ